MTTALTFGDLITLFGLGVAILGVFWKVQSNGKAEKQLLIDILVRLTAIEVKTASAGEDHDKVVELGVQVSRNKLEIQNQYDKIKSINSNHGV